MQQEDDLRGLAKVMEFMRAVSILLVIIHIYWFCYRSVHEWNINIGVVDKILLNFNRTTGLFTTILWTKLLSIIFLALSCLGTKGIRDCLKLVFQSRQGFDMGRKQIEMLGFVPVGTKYVAYFQLLPIFYATAQP